MEQMSVFGAQPGFDHKYHTVALVVPATSTGVGSMVIVRSFFFWKSFFIKERFTFGLNK